MRTEQPRSPDVRSNPLPQSPALEDAPADALRWQIADLPLGSIDRAAVAADEITFHMVTAASFIESAAELYTQNLSEHYADDPVLTAWLSDRWRWQELQHGAALRAYVEHAWPDFPWEAAYAGFLADYAQMCTVAALDRDPALELVARCVVETGTATLYRTIADLAAEPVLEALADRIYRDEIQHYKAFLRAYDAVRERRRLGRLDVLRSLCERVQEAQVSDAACAYAHAWRWRHPGSELPPDAYRYFAAQVRERARHVVPYRLSARMLLRPMRFHHRIERLFERVLEFLLRRTLFRT